MQTMPLIYQIGGVSAIAWSVSTEWFFYIVYPLILLGISRLRTIRAIAIAAGVLCIAAFSSLQLLFTMGDQINDLAVAHFGEMADRHTHWQDSFFRWLVYFSPYSRLPEFLLGCLTAAAFMKLRQVKVSLTEQQIGFAVLVAAVIGTFALHSAMFGPTQFLTRFHFSFGFAPLVAVVIFCCARYQNLITTALSSSPMLHGGDASYSLYLLHWVAIGAFSGLVPASSFHMASAIRLTVVLTAAIAISLLTYALYEAPMRQFLRRMLAMKPRAVAQSAASL
jgi:peptidoglycan/LPS O-acetylase OafA/YrhL